MHGMVEPKKNSELEEPLKKLSGSNFIQWETAVDNIADLIISRNIREHLMCLDPFPVEQLSTDKEFQRAYVILTFLCQSFIVGSCQQEYIDVSIADL